MILLSDYWMGRDAEYLSDMTAEILENATETVAKANQLLKAFGEDRKVTSGWRPPSVNAATPNAAAKSKHMTGQAIDLADPDGDLDDWCFDHLETLAEIGLWLESPASTKGWCHVQILPPKSGKRVFFP